MDSSTYETIFDFFQFSDETSLIVAAAGIVILSIISYFIAKHFIVKAVRKVIEKTKTRFDNLLLHEAVLGRIPFLAPLIIIFSAAGLFPFVEEIIQKIAAALIALLILLIIGGLLTGFNEIYLSLNVSKGRSIKGYIQILKILIYSIGTIIIICALIGKSPLVVLSGFGAMTAVILLIFRDTILSLVASVQISSNDLVRVGDWIEVPKFGADGDVIDIALHTVKIQNWDKTVTVIPTHKLLDETFKNWRGMQQSGGRRIKRSVFIDIGSIKFCDEDMINSLGKIQLISDYVKNKMDELENFNKDQGIDTSVKVNGRRMTNIGTFRAYVVAYLKSNKKIHQGMTFIVRQLPPNPSGLPLEIYVFSNDTAWANYEAIQADIFDHILAIIPEFDLRVFQNPTGEDFKIMGKAKGL